MRWIAKLSVFLALTLPLHANEICGKVVSVADGDTITVLDAAKVQHKIRLQGIDAPEKTQAFGTKSKDLITDKIAGRDVVVKWKEKDRYGRILGEVMLGTRHINLEMVQDGMALPVFFGMYIELVSLFVVPVLYCGYMEAKLHLSTSEGETPLTATAAGQHF